jgi:hypothetical protein
MALVLGVGRVVCPFKRTYASMSREGLDGVFMVCRGAGKSCPWAISVNGWLIWVVGIKAGRFLEGAPFII